MKKKMFAVAFAILCIAGCYKCVSTTEAHKTRMYSIEHLSRDFNRVTDLTFEWDTTMIDSCRILSNSLDSVLYEDLEDNRGIEDIIMKDWLSIPEFREALFNDFQSEKLSEKEIKELHTYYEYKNL